LFHANFAWQGLEGIYKLGLQGLAEEDFKRHTEAIIRLELL
jgi:hypothetical protein